MAQPVTGQPTIQLNRLHDASIRSVVDADSSVETLICDTEVSQHVSADTDDGDGRMEKINVRVPASLLGQIEETWEERGYSSKSEAIRDALRDWVNPGVTLSEETLEDLAESRKQAERGETRSLDEVAGEYGVDVDDS